MGVPETAPLAFRRYELKYLVDSVAVPALREEFARRLDPDRYGGIHGYDVCSVYYDTPQLRFYWDKVDGRPFRRKVRMRLYGDGSGIDDDTTVYVEIKQQVDRLTEKRRVPLPYRMALLLCDGREMVGQHTAQRPFLAEVLRLVSRLDLRPVAMIGYRREAFVGRDTEQGLRVTVDHRIRGRDRDFCLGNSATNRLIMPGSYSILEIKVVSGVPGWVTDLAARNHLPIVRVSKYCQSVESFGHAPPSAFHVPSPVDARGAVR